MKSNQAEIVGKKVFLSSKTGQEVCIYYLTYTDGNTEGIATSNAFGDKSDYKVGDIVSFVNWQGKTLLVN